VTDGRLAALVTGEDEFTLTRSVSGEWVPFELHGIDHLLFINHRVHIVEGHCETQQYRYSIQRTSERKSSLIRWEYLRNPPDEAYDYALGHVHVEANFLGAHDTPKPLRDMHIGTGRVALEHVLWHLISDWGVESKADDWKSILSGSVEGFEGRRRAY